MTNYAQVWHMPSLSAFTVCFWMKSSGTNAGTPFSYVVQGEDNRELLLINYDNFKLLIGGEEKYIQLMVHFFGKTRKQRKKYRKTEKSGFFSVITIWWEPSNSLNFPRIKKRVACLDLLLGFRFSILSSESSQSVDLLRSYRFRSKEVCSRISAVPN